MCYLTLFMLVLLKTSSAANILGLMGCSSLSHQLWNSVIFDELAARGHNLTILAVDIAKRPPKNVHYLHLEETYVSLFNDSDAYDIYDSLVDANDVKKIKRNYDYFLYACRGMLRSKGFEQLWNYPDDYKFDLVLYDIVFGPCLLGFVHKFNYPPIVGLSAFKLNPGVVDHVGGHTYPGYIPFYIEPFDVDMTFWQRLHNTGIYVLEELTKRLYFYPKIEKMVRTVFPPQMPKLTELEKRTTIVLANTHPVIDYPEPIPPSVIEVGGLQIKDPKPLPRNIADFLNKSINGAIFIAMGTNVKSQLVGIERQTAVLEVISSMPQYNFLWKFDPSAIKGDVPKNVIIQNWFSQSDILAHPNLKLFVTHAGSLSVQEAIWNGKPMVGVPLFVDQPRNAKRLVSQGMGETVDFIKLRADDLRNAIKKVLSDSSYTKNAQTRSKLLKDRPMKALDIAIWWIEYILRNPKPDHLKSPVISLGYVRANNIDVFIFIGIIIFLGIFCMFLIIRKVIRGMVSEGNQKCKNGKFKQN